MIQVPIAYYNIGVELEFLGLKQQAVRTVKVYNTVVRLMPSTKAWSLPGRLDWRNNIQLSSRFKRVLFKDVT